MTDTLLDYDPNDTGDIPRPVGETRMRIDLGEATVRIDPRLIKAPSFDAIPRKVFDIDDTVTYMPATIGLAGPQSPPPPLPKPPPTKSTYDPETERLSLLGSVAGIDGELRPAPLPLRHSVPYVIPADARPWTGARHARSAPLWTRVAIMVGGAMAVGGGLGLAIILAVAR